MATNLAYPFIDVLIVGLLIAVFVISDGRAGRIWVVLAVVWTLQGVSTRSTSSRRRAGRTRSGGLMDCAWPPLMLVIAVAAWQRADGRDRRAGAGAGGRSP